MLREPVQGLVPGPVGQRPQLLGGGAAQLGLPRAERGERRLGDVLGIVHGGQLHQPHAVGPGHGGALGCLLGQPRLPGPAGPEQGDEPSPRQVLPDDPDVPFPPHETGQPHPQVPLPGRYGAAGRLGARPLARLRRGGGPGGAPPRARGLRRGGRGRGQELGVQGPQGRARVRAQAGGEGAADGVVGGQCLRRAPRVLQRADPQDLERLVQRALLAQGGQLREGALGLAQGQGRREPAPARVQAYGLPPGGLGRRVREIRQRRAAPQRQGLVVQGGRLGRVLRRGSGPREPLEAVQVDVLARRDQQVPAVRRAHRPVSQRPPQPGHQRLQRGRRIRRPVRVPHLGHEHVHRHRPPRAQRERRQQRPQARSADGDGGPVVADGLGSAENRVAHRPIVTGPRPGPVLLLASCAG